MSEQGYQPKVGDCHTDPPHVDSSIQSPEERLTKAVSELGREIGKTFGVFCKNAFVVLQKTEWLNVVVDVPRGDYCNPAADGSRTCRFLKEDTHQCLLFDEKKTFFEHPKNVSEHIKQLRIDECRGARVWPE
jgi:hypothetical protein